MTGPKARRICEQILHLTEEILKGAAGFDHLSAIDSLISEYPDKGRSKEILETGIRLKELFTEDREIFQSHIDTRNCPSHDCGKLAPSPCQMACPDGIDIPTVPAANTQPSEIISSPAGFEPLLPGLALLPTRLA